MVQVNVVLAEKNDLSRVQVHIRSDVDFVCKYLDLTSISIVVQKQGLICFDRKRSLELDFAN
jgi:hypothetical protein